LSSVKAEAAHQAYMLPLKNKMTLGKSMKNQDLNYFSRVFFFTIHFKILEKRSKRDFHTFKEKKRNMWRKKWGVFLCL